MLQSTKALCEDKTIDFDRYGGIYAKTYYAMNVVDASMPYVNVPVPFKYQYVTVYYADPAMTNPVYVDIVGDPPIRQSNMIKPKK